MTRLTTATRFSPPRRHLEVLRGQLAALRRQLEVLRGQLAALRRQLAALQREMSCRAAVAVFEHIVRL